MFLIAQEVLFTDTISATHDNNKTCPTYVLFMLFTFIYTYILYPSSPYLSNYYASLEAMNDLLENIF